MSGEIQSRQAGHEHHRQGTSITGALQSSFWCGGQSWACNNHCRVCILLVYDACIVGAELGLPKKGPREINEWLKEYTRLTLTVSCSAVPLQ